MIIKVKTLVFCEERRRSRNVLVKIFQLKNKGHKLTFNVILILCYLGWFYAVFCTAYSVVYYLSLVLRKPAFCICENKDADQLRGTAKLISAFVFATRIVQSLYYLNPKFHASKHLQ